MSAWFTQEWLQAYCRENLNLSLARLPHSLTGNEYQKWVEGHVRGVARMFQEFTQFGEELELIPEITEDQARESQMMRNPESQYLPLMSLQGVTDGNRGNNAALVPCGHDQRGDSEECAGSDVGSSQSHGADSSSFVLVDGSSFRETIRNKVISFEMERFERIHWSRVDDMSGVTEASVEHSHSTLTDSSGSGSDPGSEEHTKGQ